MDRGVVSVVGAEGGVRFNGEGGTTAVLLCFRGMGTGETLTQLVSWSCLAGDKMDGGRERKGETDRERDKERDTQRELASTAKPNLPALAPAL